MSRRPSEFSADGAALVLGFVAFLVVSLLSLRGVSIPVLGLGIGNLAVVLGIALISVLLSALALLLIIDKQVWSLKTSGTAFVLMILLAGAMNDGVLKAVDSRWPLAENVAQAKIVHFCMNAYEPGRCVEFINLCPQCAKEVLPPAARKELAVKLEKFAVQMDAEIKTRELASVGSGPLSEAAKDWRKQNRPVPAGEDKAK